MVLIGVDSFYIEYFPGCQPHWVGICLVTTRLAFVAGKVLSL